MIMIGQLSHIIKFYSLQVIITRYNCVVILKRINIFFFFLGRKRNTVSQCYNGEKPNMFKYVWFHNTGAMCIPNTITRASHTFEVYASGNRPPRLAVNLNDIFIPTFFFFIEKCEEFE